MTHPDNTVKITQIDFSQIADLLTESVELTTEDQGSERVHILHHPDLGDIAVIENSGSNSGFLIQDSTTGEGIHNYLRQIATCKF